MLYSYLHQPSGDRPKPNGWMVTSGFCLVLSGLALGLTLVGGLIYIFMHNWLLLVVTCGVVMLMTGGWVFFFAETLISEIRRPTTTGWGGWDWF